MPGPVRPLDVGDLVIVVNGVHASKTGKVIKREQHHSYGALLTVVQADGSTFSVEALKCDLKRGGG